VTVSDFQALLAPAFKLVGEHTPSEALHALLDEQLPPNGDWFQQVHDACTAAIQEGWMCKHEAGGIQYGRVIKPSEATHLLSVDVVRMENIKGPHHRHPNGEVDLVLPITADAKFDGVGRGWVVYPPESAHHPTVTDGAALVLYLLPGGAIEFT